jgi:uncharacterized membrane protein
MNLAHLHLLLNHFPIIGTIIGLGLFLVSLVGKNADLRRASLIVLAVIALVALPTFFSGVGAQGAIKGEPGVSEALIERHEGAAILALLFMEITGALALVELWQLHRISRPVRWNWTLSTVLVFSIVTTGLMARVGTTGGEVRHPEIRSGQATTAVEGSMLSEITHALEPSPTKLTQLMLDNKFWWAFMMDMHFIGLALLVGTIGVLDLRMLGFAKKLPIGPLHQLVPWALVGFGINLVTGVLAFIGMPTFYTYDVAFWLKMSAIMLLGLNVAAFYLTDTFETVEGLGPGEDAPPLAKFIAATSLFLCFAVIAFGRYIQWFSDNVDNISTH